MTEPGTTGAADPVPSIADHKQVLLGYLRTARQALLWKLDGLSDYDVRRPLTPTGTNLLGIVKHVGSVEMGYFTEVFGRPCPAQFPWFDEGAEPNADLWATPDESRDDICALYRQSWQVSDETILELPLDTVGHVPWWPPERQHPTLLHVMIHMIAETNRHAGHADIVRELIDEAAGWGEGNDLLAPGDTEWWREYRSRLEAVARGFRPS